MEAGRRAVPREVVGRLSFVMPRRAQLRLEIEGGASGRGVKGHGGVLVGDLPGAIPLDQSHRGPQGHEQLLKIIRAG